MLTHDKTLEEIIGEAITLAGELHSDMDYYREGCYHNAVIECLDKLTKLQEDTILQIKQLIEEKSNV